MKKALILAALLLWLAGSCSPRIPGVIPQLSYKEMSMKDVDRVVYQVKSGPIWPEMQYTEEIVITRDGVRITREGKTAISHINSGSWKIAVDLSAVEVLFADLKKIDCAEIKRIETLDPPDDGDTECFTVEDQNETRCSLCYVPGIAYKSGDLIVEPIRNFIEALDFPLGAKSRYVER